MVNKCSSQQFLKLFLNHTQFLKVLLLLLHIWQKQVIQFLTNRIQWVFHLLLSFLIFHLSQTIIIHLNVIGNKLIRIVISFLYKCQYLFGICWCCFVWVIFTVGITCCAGHWVRWLINVNVISFLEIWFRILRGNVWILIVMWKDVFKLNFIIETFRALTWLWALNTGSVFSYVFWLIREPIIDIFRSTVWFLIITISLTLNICRVCSFGWMIFIFLKLNFKLNFLKSLRLWQ